MPIYNVETPIVKKEYDYSKHYTEVLGEKILDGLHSNLRDKFQGYDVTLSLDRIDHTVVDTPINTKYFTADILPIRLNALIDNSNMYVTVTLVHIKPILGIKLKPTLRAYITIVDSVVDLPNFHSKENILLELLLASTHVEHMRNLFTTGNVLYSVDYNKTLKDLIHEDTIISSMCTRLIRGSNNY